MPYEKVKSQCLQWRLSKILRVGGGASAPYPLFVGVPVKFCFINVQKVKLKHGT